MLAKLRFLTAAAVMLSLSSQVRAQTTDHRMEVGMQYTALTLSVFDSVESGIGGRWGLRVNRYLTVETECTYFPKSNLGNSGIDDKGQCLVGIKSGFSNRRVGLFGKVRPGMVQFPSLKFFREECRKSGNTLFCPGKGKSAYKLALDLGGVFEAYPTRAYVIRVDVGDTLIRFKDDTRSAFPLLTRVPDGFSHNLQVTFGVGFRF